MEGQHLIIYGPDMTRALGSELGDNTVGLINQLLPPRRVIAFVIGSTLGKERDLREEETRTCVSSFL